MDLNHTLARTIDRAMIVISFVIGVTFVSVTIWVERRTHVLESLLDRGRSQGRPRGEQRLRSRATTLIRNPRRSKKSLHATNRTDR